jgi:hypothetical protein
MTAWALECCGWMLIALTANFKSISYPGNKPTFL